MTGRLHGTLWGRPVEIVADGRDILIVISSLRSAWRARHSFTYALLPIHRSLRNLGFQLRVQIGKRLKLQILPKPQLAVRLFMPDLALSRDPSN